MSADRRTFLGGMIAAAVLPGFAVGAVKRADFPILILELGGKYTGEGKGVATTDLTARRLVTVDLENEEDWGDVNRFWDGESMSFGLGNDMDGYWKIERVFEIVEPRVELQGERFPLSCERTLDQFAALMGKRIDSWG